MPTEMDLTDFRRELTDVVDKLPDTGPVHLLRYGMIVAEIHPADPASRRARTLQTAKIIERLQDMEIFNNLIDVGIDTFDQMQHLLQRMDSLTARGATFSDYPGHALSDVDASSVNEALARLHFGESNLPKQDIVAWFEASTAMQIAARERSMDTDLPHPNAYDDDEPTFIESVIAAGHTPASIVTFAERALDQGVALNQLLDLLGDEALPPDVLAHPNYDEYKFEQITSAGLPVAEATALVRSRQITFSDISFVGAGVRTAQELDDLAREGVSVDLARRAARDGLTPEQWRPLVPRLQRLRYKGTGNLPFQLLVQAAEENLSLVRWDDSKLPVEQDQIKYFHADAALRMAMYPWGEVYDWRVLDVARAGLSPSYITAFAKLMDHHFRPKSESGLTQPGLVDLAILAHDRGLTASMANVMSRVTAKRPQFTPDTLITALDLGLTEAQAYVLADTYAWPSSWISDLSSRARRQPLTDRFLADITDTDAWATATATARHTLKQKKYLRPDAAFQLTLDQLIAGKRPLDYKQVLQVLRWTLDFLTEAHYAPKKWAEEHQPRAGDVEQLYTTFSNLLKEESDQAKREKERDSA